jgi:hypothetical protein
MREVAKLPFVTLCFKPSNKPHRTSSRIVSLTAWGALLKFNESSPDHQRCGESVRVVNTTSYHNDSHSRRLSVSTIQGVVDSVEGYAELATPQINQYVESANFRIVDGD